MADYADRIWFVGVLSLIPGAGMMAVGKKELGLMTLLGVCALFLIFLFQPNLFTWFLFVLAFLAQMAYAIAVVTWRTTPLDEATQIQQALPLPKRFQNRRTMGDEVYEALEKVLERDEELESAVVGPCIETKRLMFAGITETHLLLASCSARGKAQDVQRIGREAVRWVVWHKGGQFQQLSIDLESGERYTLLVSIALNIEAGLIFEAFPGTQSEKDIRTTFTQGHIFLKSVMWKLTLPFVLVTIAYFALMAYFRSIGMGSAAIEVVSNFMIGAFGVWLFLISWLLFAETVHFVKKEPGISFVSVILWIRFLRVLAMWFWLFYALWISVIPLLK
jgi:hypothetical protein